MAPIGFAYLRFVPTQPRPRDGSTSAHFHALLRNDDCPEEDNPGNTDDNDEDDAGNRPDVPVLNEEGKRCCQNVLWQRC